jgi:hypothetical protein
MSESTSKPTAQNHIYTQVLVKNPDLTESLIDAFIYFDCILPAPDGRIKLIAKWNVSEETRTFDDITTTFYTYQEAWIKWSPPATYIKDGVEIPLGIMDENGLTTISKEQAVDYIICSAAPEIAGYAMKTKTVYVG